MRRPGLFWATAVGSLAVLDVWADRNTVAGDTVSECTRTLFRTHSPLGRVVFLATWGTFATWFARHITKE